MTNLRPPAIVINDSTLRDVDRIAGGMFSERNQSEVVTSLERLGVQEIEFAMPAPGGTPIDDLAAVVSVMGRAQPRLWGPASRRTVDVAARAGIKAVTLSVKLSGQHVRPAVLDRLTRIIVHARDRGLAVALCGADASRADFDLIRTVIAAAEAAGASRFRYTDTMGVLHPIRTHALFRELCAETDLELEFRGHDDFGLATANTVAAVEGGATHVSVSLIRHRELSNTAQLDDVVSAIRMSTLHPVGVDLALVPPLVSRIALMLGLKSTGRRGTGRWMPPHEALTRGFGAAHGMEGR
jgi:homocitrate synthase NifV